MIAIVDCGIGNLRSVERALHHLGFDAVITHDLPTVTSADVLVLPGQGAFEETMRNLTRMGVEAVVKSHIAQKRPFLGICIGFQVLFESSEENGTHKGLGIFPGHFRAFDRQTLTVPLMGWNQLEVASDPNRLFSDSPEPYVYFANSYYLPDTDAAIVSTTTDYGGKFVSSIQAKNLFATQFHPEKSGETGLKLLKRFLDSVS